METRSHVLQDLAQEIRGLDAEAHERSLKGQVQICCTVPKDLLDEFIDRVARSYYPRGLSEAVADLMSKALLEYGPKPEHPFVEHRTFDLPRSAFVLVSCPPGESRKVQQWLQRNDRLDIWPATKELFIVNQSEASKQKHE